MQVSTDMKESLGLTLPPRFFHGAEGLVRDHFVKSIRRFYLVPAFRSLGTGEDAQERGDTTSWV